MVVWGDFTLDLYKFFSVLPIVLQILVFCHDSGTWGGQRGGSCKMVLVANFPQDDLQHPVVETRVLGRSLSHDTG